MNEGYIDPSGNESPRLNGEQGYCAKPKAMRPYQVRDNDSAKNYWWSTYPQIEEGAKGSAGNQNTINNENQGTLQGLYGISFKVNLAQDMSLDDVNKSTDDIDHMKASEKIQKKIAESINRTLMNVRVAYTDGTYETTQF